MKKLTDVYLSLAKQNYRAYCYLSHGGRWKAGKAVSFIADTIQDFIEKDTGNPHDILVLSMPPQHGKSMTITETLPSWFLINNPNKRVIIASYNETTAKRFGSKNLTKLTRYGGLYGIKTGSPANALNTVLNNGVGGFISRGLMSGITGNPGELIIIDDPIKTREEADSPTIREKLIDEWTSSIKSRLHPKGKVIVIMTRWRYDDFIGYLTENEPFTQVLNIPCEAEENDPLGREVGDALAPELGKDNEWLKGFKQSFTTEKGLMVWLAQYQGKPGIEKGNIFNREWFQFYSTPPVAVTGCISVDATFKDKDTSDFVAIQVWIKNNIDYVLLKRVKKRMGFIDTVKELIEIKKQYDYPLLIEDIANGTAIIETLRLQLSDVLPIEPKGGKVARANAVAPMFESKNVWVLNSDEYIKEFLEFPHSKHDDEVDCTTQALTWLKDKYAIEEVERLPNIFDFFTEKTESEEYIPI